MPTPGATLQPLRGSVKEDAQRQLSREDSAHIDRHFGTRTVECYKGCGCHSGGTPLKGKTQSLGTTTLAGLQQAVRDVNHVIYEDDSLRMNPWFLCWLLVGRIHDKAEDTV